MLKQRRIFQKLVALILALTICFGALPSYALAIEGEQPIEVKLTGHVPEEIVDSTNSSVKITGETIAVSAGVYSYKNSDGSAGSFVVDNNTTEIEFAQVKWKSAWPVGNGTLKMFQGEYEFTATGSNENTTFIVPAYEGDCYYTWSFEPEDDSILPQTGHVYIYGDEGFAPLNLSDGGTIPYMQKNIVTVRAPKGMEVFLTSQLKFYMARDYQKCTPTNSDEQFDYYTMHAPTTTTGSSQIFMLRQDGKATRYGFAEQVGVWNEDKTVLTLRELTGDPYQINRDQSYFDANIMTNLPTDSQIELSTGEYFDLVPLRAWQAVGSISGNNYQDPPYNYYVIGDSVEVTVTEDDEIGQYGRITAVKPGVSLVLFSYEAMEWLANTTSDTDEYKLLLYSALWPELTGIAVVKVDQGETGIKTNIDMTEGRTVYFLRSQTSATGVTEERDSYATYSFTPTSSTDDDISVRVHSPIMVEDGSLPSWVTSTTNWLKDKKWKSYTKNEDGSFTVQLSEGRNIVEVKSGEQTEYHVITARGVDVTLDNVYNPGNLLSVGDTVKVTFKGLVPALYKQAAIYNPSGNPLIYLANGEQINRDLGQYTVSTNASFTVALTEEDEGVFRLTNGGIATSYWGSSGQNYHRELTRCSMSSVWTGGNNPEIDLGMLAILPDISFEVVSNEELDEVEARKSSLLEGILISVTNADSGEIKLKETLGTEESPALRNWAQMGNANQPIKVGAKPLYEQNGTILVRTWFGNDPTGANLTEIPVSSIFQEKNKNNVLLNKITLTQVLDKGLLTKTSGPLNVEVISVPESGTPTTYAKWLYHKDGVATANPVLKDLKITAAQGSGTFGRFDGILEAQDITYTDSDGQQQPLDFGYGFILTEYNYTTQVPYETDKITYSATVNGKSFSATINGGDTVYQAGDAIPLNYGENTLVVTAVSVQGNTTDYTITITRAAAPEHVTFSVPAGASVTVKKSGKTQQPLATGEGVVIYNLPGGDYTYSVELDGYYTKTGSFTAPVEKADQPITVEFTDADKLPAYTGTFQVAINGQQEQLCPLTTMTIPAKAADLQAKKYVTYNHGGYTVLHALIEACQSAGASFKCSKGVLTPSTTVDSSQTCSGSGWVCEVNGAVVDPFTTLVQPNDVIRFYYNNNAPGMVQAWFTTETLSTQRGESVTVNVMGRSVQQEEAAAVAAYAELVALSEEDGETAEPTAPTLSGVQSSVFAIKGADILVDGVKVAETGWNGSAIIDTSKLLLGSHVITVEFQEEGVNLLTYAQADLTVSKAVDPDADPDTTTVTFRLIGDNKHSESSHEYTTWIATESYCFDAPQVVVADVLKLALECAGLEAKGIDNNYVTSITAPASLGGYTLAEFDNGTNSGWMYTVNGVHTDYGVKEQVVTNGDEIIFHYADDWTTEETQFTWLTAADVNPEGIDPEVPAEPVTPVYPTTPVDPSEPVDPDRPVTPDQPSLNLPASVKEMYQKTAATLLSQTPGTGSVGGEWLMLGLARSTFADQITDSNKSTYLAAVKAYIAENYDSNTGRLNTNKPTENARIALALTALGYDPTSFEGYDLLKALEQTGWTTWQGNNSTAFALLAFDAAGYNASNREDLIQSLLTNQLSSGAWSISGTDENDEDQDITMMVVQSLAPYYSRENVKAAVDNALTWIKTKQTDDGGFGTTVEGNAQVIVTLTALGIDPTGAEWTNASGKNVIDGLASYFTGGGFQHVLSGSYNQMATEQSFYALVAYVRYLNQQPGLYEMAGTDSWPSDSGSSDTPSQPGGDPVVIENLVEEMASFTVYDASYAAYQRMTALQAAYDALTDEEKAAMDGLKAAYTSFKSEKREFSDLLDDCIDEALEELEWEYDGLDKDDYSTSNWKRIKEIRTNAKKAIRSAQYAEQTQQYLASALASMNSVSGGGEIEVTFRLIGDLSHTSASQHQQYITWVETTEYELEAGSTVYDLFVEAMSDARLSHKGASSNYVSTIQAPKCLGSYWLGEFDNGRNSGWMYTVNGTHPSYGLKEWELQDGDEVIWHYVDDYTTEEYRYTWLEAKDISPEDYVEDLLEDVLTVGSHGSATPNRLKASDLGGSVTFRFTPNSGYEVKNVTVDGKSMGPITSYTYKNLTISSRISVEFVKSVSIDFTDVHTYDWFYDDVKFAVQNGLFQGTSDTEFSPNSSMTRAMLVTVLYRLEGEPTVYGYSSFDDVASSQWYTKAVIWAQQNDIVNGIGNGKFGVNDSVTREQLAALLYRYASYRGYRTYSTTTLNRYSDQSQISAYALTAMKWANAESLISGRTSSALDPKGTATRAEVAAILHRFVENLAS